MSETLSKFTKFFKNKKADRHFKKSGPGVRLDGGATSSQPPADRVNASDAAAQAAMRRLQGKVETPKPTKIQMLAKQQMEAERRLEQEMEKVNVKRAPAQEPEELEHSSAISKVMFTTEILEGEVATKPELLKRIQNFLAEQVRCGTDDEEKFIAAVLMIYSLNKSDAKETAVKTITTICQNILQNPTEDRYKTIKLSNKNIQEKIIQVVGGREFLEAVGFEERGEEDARIMVFTREKDAHLTMALDALKEGQAVPIKVARCLQLKTLHQDEKVEAPKLSKDFYNLTAAEVRAEQDSRSAQVERMTTLRTKEMRMRDEQQACNRYKYTLIRVRLPNNVLMQGVFGCQEPLSAVRLFVASVLSPSMATSEFSLRDISGHSVDDESITLAALGLAPAALLHLNFAQMPLEGEQLIDDEHLHLLDAQDPGF